ncbi:hypothetical protein [Methylobacterium radiotolerans]|uniref:Uncharacterized protein n=1 Tax=Methylobacterium radiotolerans (strain ATCC 27329 / DSM 1819 / JCM 2831 / NBRC 15690 / NCIMB 10815 / 0-1) TaxID=426355 RepID=B1M2N3_METRJ|nr:hypothetical protein [Methylobacterium radiotolerans]ACB27681.1 hypothetical protein Mrad2831_5736 [Methylobacterium radiotolerans JCM 2831]GEM95877.1 hypothetical protein MRA01_04170 [Methylobacterium radiotolerans]
MNAQHPIRAAFGHLPKVAPHLVESVAEDQPLVRLAPGVTVQSLAEPLPSASEALGRLESSLAILDAISESTLSAVHHLERATIAGAGQRADMGRLEDVAAKLAAAARRAEAARARVADKLAGAR